MKVEPLTPYIPRRKIGLGDAVEAVAKPVARIVDAVTGSNLANCQPCTGRKETLNEAVPNMNPFHHG